MQDQREKKSYSINSSLAKSLMTRYKSSKYLIDPLVSTSYLDYGTRLPFLMKIYSIGLKNDYWVLFTRATRVVGDQVMTSAWVLNDPDKEVKEFIKYNYDSVRVVPETIQKLKIEHLIDLGIITEGVGQVTMMNSCRNTSMSGEIIYDFREKNLLYKTNFSKLKKYKIKDLSLLRSTDAEYREFDRRKNKLIILDEDRELFTNKIYLLVISAMEIWVLNDENRELDNLYGGSGVVDLDLLEGEFKVGRTNDQIDHLKTIFL